MTASDLYREYWDSFYASQAESVPPGPSPFARWVQGRLRPGQPVVELGFGTARDSLWFAGQGHPVSGYDFAATAVARARGLADGQGLPATFNTLDLYDTSAVQVAAKEIAHSTSAPAVYGRFLIHSLEADGRANLLDLAAELLGDGGELYLEFRTGQDQGQQHVFGDDHFRVFLDPEIVVGEIEARSGTTIYQEAARGLAVYKSEDPHVARLVARWSE